MGQGDSKINGAIVFAYQVSLGKQYYLEPKAKETVDNDPILTRPELYGLDSTSSISFLKNSTDVKYEKRPDSGYMSPDESIEEEKLAQDLTYVDLAYYPSRYHSNQQQTFETNNEVDEYGMEVSFTDVMFASPDKTLSEVYLSCRAIQKLSPNIGMLTMIRKLDLSNNHLTELPASIGYLQNLEAFSVAKNCLVSLPDTICHLTSLLELDVSYNQLTSITPYLGCLEKLKSLTVAVNRITHLPTEIRGLTNLISLDLSRNPLTVLPAEVAQLPYLRRIRCEDCPFQHSSYYSLKHDPPSLKEICARTALQKQINLRHVAYLPAHMVEYIKSAKTCSFCQGPYFERCVLRGRLMEKSDVHIPLQYTLCNAHWSNGDDRILSMFGSPQPPLQSTVEILPYRPALTMVRNINNKSLLHHTTVVAPKSRNNEYSTSKSTLSKLSVSFKRPSIPW